MIYLFEGRETPLEVWPYTADIYLWIYARWVPKIMGEKTPLFREKGRNLKIAPTRNQGKFWGKESYSQKRFNGIPPLKGDITTGGPPFFSFLGRP